jgi:ABC-2 type transport system ATP-binding protein
LLEELRDRGVSVLLNSHLLSEIELVCDRVVIVRAGEVVAAGSPAELAQPRGVELETDEGTRTIEGATRGDAPKLVAETVAAGRSVYGVRVLTSTLEETYLEAVGDEVS